MATHDATWHKHEAKIDDETAESVLQGLTRHSWAGLVALNETLKDEEENYIQGTYEYPPTPGARPVETDIVSVDLGKSRFKIGTVDWMSRFVPTVIQNAYCKSKAVQFETKGGKKEDTIYQWRVLQPAPQEVENQKIEHESFWIGDPAMKYADELPINADSFLRLREQRVRNFFYAGLVQALRNKGSEPTQTITKDGHTSGTYSVGKTHYLAVVLGLPYLDVVNMSQETKDIIKSLYGGFRIEAFNVKTEEKEIWDCHISTIYPIAQSRGTQVAVCSRLNGDPATDKEEIIVFDGGGGDAHVLRFNISGALQTIGDRRGDGTVEVAQELVTLVRQRTRVKITVPQAQEALYTHTIKKAGGAHNITYLIEELGTRFENLVQRMMPGEDMLDALIIYTGGLSALLSSRLHAQLGKDGMKLTTGIDYIVVPTEIATIINCLGLFAYGYYRIRDEVYNWCEEYLDEQAQYSTNRANMDHFLKVNPTQRTRVLKEIEALDQRQQALAAHVAQYYPFVLEEVQEDRAAEEAE